MAFRIASFREADACSVIYGITFDHVVWIICKLRLSELKHV